MCMQVESIYEIYKQARVKLNDIRTKANQNEEAYDLFVEDDATEEGAASSGSLSYLAEELQTSVARFRI